MSSALPAVASSIQKRAPALRQYVTLASTVSTLLAMLWRDVLVACKQFFSTLILLLFQPALLLFALGRVQAFTGGLPPAFANILVPGVLGSVIISVSVQAVSSPLIVEFSYTREIQDRLLSPIPVWLVGVEKMVVGMIKAWVCCCMYFPLAWLILGPGLYNLNADHLWLFALALFLGSLMMSALGLLVGSATQGAQANIVLTVFIMPMSFLGCVYFTWVGLSHARVFQYLALLDPQTYMSELFRGTLTTQPHLSFVWAFAGLLIWSALFFYVGLRAFMRRALH